MNKKQVQLVLVSLIIMVLAIIALLVLVYPQTAVQPNQFNNQGNSIQNNTQKAVLTAESDQNVQNYVKSYNGSASIEEINQSLFQTLQQQEPVIYGNLTVQNFPLYAITFNSSETPSYILAIVADGQIVRMFPVIGIKS